MIHKIDKETIKRIVDLHQKQGLSFPILCERFGVSMERINGIIRRHREKQQDASDKTFKVSPRVSALMNADSARNF